MLNASRAWLLSATLLPLSLPCFAQAQSDLLGTIHVRIDSEVPVKSGSAVEARTVEDFYTHDTLAVPHGTAVLGHVTAVKKVSRKKRLDAMSRGDFTPLRVPEVEFTQLKLANGQRVALAPGAATQGSEMVRFYAQGSQRRSLWGRAWTALVGRKNAAVKAVTAPGKKDRMEDFLYSQLPWHPQEIEDGTVYEIRMPDGIQGGATAAETVEPGKDTDKHIELQAKLLTPLDSSKVKNGEAVQAVVTAPVFGEHQEVEIPQGALLNGHVLRARPSRGFGRNGALRFSFNQLQMPQGFQRKVKGVATGIDSDTARGLNIDTEGGVERSSNKGVLAPLALGLLSVSALSEDEASLGHAATASNGFGLIGRVISVATKSNVFGGVIGGIDTARVVYTRFIAHGKDVVFPRGTSIEVDLGNARALAETIRQSDKSLDRR